MAKIARLDCKVWTGRLPGGSTHGAAYLGVCGREFRLDKSGDNDFQPDTTDPDDPMVFIMGSGSNVAHQDENDPRTHHELKTEALGRFPVYLRFEPEAGDDRWNLERIDLVVNPGPGEVQYQALGPSEGNLWLGRIAGKVCYLSPA